MKILPDTRFYFPEELNKLIESLSQLWIFSSHGYFKLWILSDQSKFLIWCTEHYQVAKIYGLENFNWLQKPSFFEWLSLHLLQFWLKNNFYFNEHSLPTFFICKPYTVYTAPWISKICGFHGGFRFWDPPSGKIKCLSH